MNGGRVGNARLGPFLVEILLTDESRGGLENVSMLSVLAFAARRETVPKWTGFVQQAWP